MDEEAPENLKQIIYGGTLAFLVLASFVIFFLVMYLRRKSKHIIETQQMKANFQQELLRTQLEIQEQTLKNISQEIHDNIGQMLSLAKLNLATADIEQKDMVQQKITDSHQLVSKAIQDLRDLSHSLNTDYVAEMGLLRSIEYELEMIRKTGIIKTVLDVTGQVYKLNPQKELIVFRIVQETFNNIIKHARAKTISIDINYSISGIVLKIADDGDGFVSKTVIEDGIAATGLGIRNMHNRAKLIGADFKVESSLGSGTEIIIQLPKENNNGNAKNG